MEVQRHPVNAGANTRVFELGNYVRPIGSGRSLQTNPIKVPRVNAVRQRSGQYQLIHIAQQLGIKTRPLSAPLMQRIRFAKLLNADRCRNIGQIVFVAGRDDFIEP